MTEEVENSDVIVIGGGLAGLTVTALLARAGKSVSLFERDSRDLGGRARTQVQEGFYFNQGPHALFPAGLGAAILEELGINYTGGKPPVEGLVITNAKKFKLLTNSGSVAKRSTTHLDSEEVFSRLFEILHKTDFTELENVSVQSWIEQNFHDADEIELVKAIIRLTSYGNDPSAQSAGSALHQIHLYGLGGVVYLDRGWQTLLDGLISAAKDASARIVTGRRATKVQRYNSGWRVTLLDQNQVSARVIVIAAGPNEALALFHDGEKPKQLSKAVNESKPVHLACLDVALRTLPQKDMLFALGIESPVYFSVHSAYAKLAPDNGALIHVAKFLGTSIQSNPREDEKELEDLLDLLQPGWREVLVKKRPLPNMMVSNALVIAANGGLLGRPGPKIDNGLYAVGDWLGNEGLLSNGSFASARRAAKLILEELGKSSGVHSENPSTFESISS